jgi:integrase
VPAKVVADRLGHSGVAITLDTYTHRVEQLDRDTAEAVSKLIHR